MNVTPVWKEGITGKGVTVCIIDDGVDHLHKDIKRAFVHDVLLIIYSAVEARSVLGF